MYFGDSPTFWRYISPASGFLLGLLTLQSEDRKQYFPSKCWGLSKLHAVTIEKTSFYMVTAVRTTDPTN
jgi:hypothetical protein